jgi:hypothetical protein
MNNGITWSIVSYVNIISMIIAVFLFVYVFYWTRIDIVYIKKASRTIENKTIA